MRAAAARFRILVPRRFAALMEQGNPRDPLLRQVLPIGEEMSPHPGFLRDPVGDRAALKSRGILLKYPGRALVLTTGACAVHCRYCFRRHFPYGEATATRDQGAAAVEQLASSPNISEVILSGGDPLMLDDQALADLVRKLRSIPHLKRLRIHTRLPIVLPSRVTPALCQTVTGFRSAPVMVLHANHPRELSAEVESAAARLRAAGITLLNQSVLLKGVNDSVPVLSELSERLVECGVLPYYLHLLDRVEGAAHFEVPRAEATGLVGALRRLLPGYLVPRLAWEEAGRSCKTILI